MPRHGGSSRQTGELSPAIAAPRPTGCTTPKVVGASRAWGRVEGDLLVTLAALGVRRVSLVQARCAQCEHVSGFEMARVVWRTLASALLATWNNDMRIDLAEKLPSSVRRAGDEGYDASRRGFFPPA